MTVPISDELTQDRLSANALKTFESQGFAQFSEISEGGEVERIRAILTDLLSQEAGAKDGQLFDTMASAGDIKSRRSLQLTNPSKFAPQLLETGYVRKAREVAERLLGPECVLRMDFALVKPAQVGAGTPWHQDEAYRDSRFEYREITFWMPLQDVGVDDGCMVFVPGSHLEGVYEHRSFGNDASKHVIECDSELFPEDKAVACPMKAGDCSVHNQRTLHCTRDNLSGLDRYAYILVFGMASTPPTGKELFPWLAAREAAKVKAKRAWLLRGGAVMLIWHKTRRGDFRNTRELWASFKKGAKALRLNR